MLFNGRGGWHPNTTKIIVGRGAPNEGNRVVTDKAIYFMQWDDIAYHIIFKKDFAEIRSVKPYHYLNKWFVLQTGDMQFDMFAFPFDSGKTEQVCTYLKQRIQKTGQ